MDATAFFYGTLIHPHILARVIKNDGSHLKIAPAVLNSYVRHHVRYASYPAIMPYELSERFLGVNLEESERRVRGVVVRGLTMGDMQCIHVFEGKLYKRVSVDVKPLCDFTPFKKEIDPYNSASVEEDGSGLESLKCFTYVWDQAINDLSADIWSYESFLKNSLHVYL